MNRARSILAFAVAVAAAAGAYACGDDGVTPDCTTDPTVCAPIYGDQPDAAEAAAPFDAGVPEDAGSLDSGDAGDGDTDAADAAG